MQRTAWLRLATGTSCGKSQFLAARRSFLSSHASAHVRAEVSPLGEYAPLVTTRPEHCARERYARSRATPLSTRASNNYIRVRRNPQPSRCICSRLRKRTPTRERFGANSPQSRIYGIASGLVPSCAVDHLLPSRRCLGTPRHKPGDDRQRPEHWDFARQSCALCVCRDVETILQSRARSSV
jgi:hypothetical protein